MAVTMPSTCADTRVVRLGIALPMSVTSLATSSCSTGATPTDAAGVAAVAEAVSASTNTTNIDRIGILKLEISANVSGATLTWDTRPILSSATYS